jgi:hypothetical protein
MSHSLRSSVAAGLLALTLPVSAMAATPVQLVQQSLVNVGTKFLASYQFTADATVTDTAFTPRTVNEAKVKLLVDQRLLAAAGDTEGTLTFSISANDTSSLASSFLPRMTATNVSLDWKRSGTDTYLRLRNIPASWLSSLGLATQYPGIDFNAYLDHWVKIDGEAADEVNQAFAQREQILKAEFGGAKNAELLAMLKGTNLFLVTRTEKTWTNANGDKLTRVQLRLNPGVLTNWRNAALKKVDKKSTYAKYDIQSINTQYASGQKFLKRVAFAANVNLTTQSLERLEYVYQGTEPKTTCTYNPKTYTSNCTKVVGSTAYRVTGALTLKKDSGAAIAVPGDALSLQVLTNAIKQADDARYKSWQTPPATFTSVDSDGDTLTDDQEAQLGTNIFLRDTDQDGLTDGAEVNTYGTDPRKPDSDGDGVSDAAEIQANQNPLGAGACTKASCLR